MTDKLIIIGLAGHAGAGKDTAARHLVARYGFVQAAFADPIRDMAALLFEQIGVPDAYLRHRAMKERPLPELGFSPRALMQVLGTEVGRALSADLWVRHLELRLGLQPNGGLVHDRIVISDVRFPNEAAWVRSKGGKVVRLVRPQAQGQARQHVSETALDGLTPDYDVLNDGATEWALQMRLDRICEDLGAEERPALRGIVVDDQDVEGMCPNF
jgi:hypothetical protein